VTSDMSVIDIGERSFEMEPTKRHSKIVAADSYGVARASEGEGQKNRPIPRVDLIRKG